MSPTDAKKPLKDQKGSARKRTLPKNKRSYKIDKKSSLGKPKVEPGCTKNEAKIEKHGLNCTKWLPDGSQDPFTQKVP